MKTLISWKVCKKNIFSNESYFNQIFIPWFVMFEKAEKTHFEWEHKNWIVPVFVLF